MKSDDEKLRELFEIKEIPTFNKEIRRAKFFSTIRTVIVSFMIFIIIGFIFLVSNATALNIIGSEKEESLIDWFNIAMPNSYVGNHKVDDRIIVGEIDYVRYRFLGNKIITDGNYKETYTYVPLINRRDNIYSTFHDYLVICKAGTSETFVRYGKEGRRIMNFYHPSQIYENYQDDFEEINKIDNNKVAEIALSFDKGYSLEEVKEIVPKELTLNWYWVDSYNQRDLNNNILDEFQVYGIKTIDRNGNQIDNPCKEFIDTIFKNKDNNEHYEIYKKIYNNLSDEKGEIKKEDLKIIGIVVSGDVDKLKTLKGKGFIKAATLGAVSDKY